MKRKLISVCFLVLCLRITKVHSFWDDVYDKPQQQQQQQKQTTTTTDNRDQASLDMDLMDRNQYEEGKKEYETIVRDSVRYGVCWQTAIDSLHLGCKQLTEEVQHRLALAFANCFLEKTGMKTYPCDPDISVKICLADMSDRAFTAHTQFFTHTQSICFFLMSELWQRKTQETVNLLSQTASEVSHRLGEASQSLEQLQELQSKSVDTQTLINEELLNSRRSFEEYKASTAEQRLMLNQILDKLSDFQQVILLTISYYDTIGFVIASMIVIYLFTSTKRTHQVRLTLFLILVAEGIIESCIAHLSSYVLHYNHLLMPYASDAIYFIKGKARLIRWLSWICMAYKLFKCAYNYKDINEVNNQLLMDMSSQMKNFFTQQNGSSFWNNNRKQSEQSDGDESDETYVMSDDCESQASDDTNVFSEEEDDDKKPLQTSLQSFLRRSISPCHERSHTNGFNLSPSMSPSYNLRSRSVLLNLQSPEKNHF